MASIRILVPTFRRTHLLTRALESLKAQTFTDWVCEVHNDDPGDPEPERIVAKLSDPRIRCVNHERNLGITGTFNFLYSTGDEPYGSMLEDDNWWEPTLLERLYAVLETHPECGLAWSNMYQWKEDAHGNWIKLGQTVWPVPQHPGLRVFSWPSSRHVYGHLHSNGAALCRLNRRSAHIVPDPTLPGNTEALRERSLCFPIILLEEPLAHLSITRVSGRPRNPDVYFAQQVLLAASYFRHVAPESGLASEVWHMARTRPGRSTHVLFTAACISRKFHWVMKAGWLDWLWFLGWALKHPATFREALHLHKRFPEIWHFLDQRTGEITARSAGISMPESGRLPPQRHHPG